MFLCCIPQTWNFFNSYYDENIERYRIDNTSRLLSKEEAVFMFDAVWTAALAIQSTASKLPSGVTLRDFTYNGKLSRNISRLLYEEALKVKFFGLSVSEIYSILALINTSVIRIYRS